MQYSITVYLLLFNLIFVFINAQKIFSTEREIAHNKRSSAYISSDDIKYPAVRLNSNSYTDTALLNTALPLSLLSDNYLPFHRSESIDQEYKEKPPSEQNSEKSLYEEFIPALKDRNLELSNRFEITEKKLQNRLAKEIYKILGIIKENIPPAFFKNFLRYLNIPLTTPNEENTKLKKRLIEMIQAFEEIPGYIFAFLQKYKVLEKYMDLRVISLNKKLKKSKVLNFLEKEKNVENMAIFLENNSTPSMTLEKVITICSSPQLPIFLNPMGLRILSQYPFISTLLANPSVKPLSRASFTSSLFPNNVELLPQV